MSAAQIIADRVAARRLIAAECTRDLYTKGHALSPGRHVTLGGAATAAQILTLGIAGAARRRPLVKQCPHCALRARLPGDHSRNCQINTTTP